MNSADDGKDVPRRERRNSGKTPREPKASLLPLLERVAALERENAALRDEIARLKGLNRRPKFQPERDEDGD